MDQKDVLLERYRDSLFAEYIASKYNITNDTIVKNQKFLKLVYALEWYQIPKHAVWDLIEFHPDLTREDYNLLQ